MNTEITENNKCNVLVVEGDAMRGIFSTGVLDAFLSRNFNSFDICIGVSAGATNIAPYLAEMYQRNFKVYTDYSIRPDFISWEKFILGGHLVDLDWQTLYLLLRRISTIQKYTGSSFPPIFLHYEV